MNVTAVSIGLAIPALAIITPANADDFTEFDAFGTDTAMITGSIGSTNVSAFIVNGLTGGDSNHVFRAPASTFTNDSSRFTDPTYYSPASDVPTDHLAFSMFNATTDANSVASLTFVFSNPLTDPVFHFNGLDRVSWDFSPTTTDLSALTDDGTLDATAFMAGIVQDSDGNTINDLPALGGSFDGSIQINGTYAAITIHLRETLDRSDGYRFQISAIPAPHGIVAITLGGLMTFRRRR